MIDSSGHSMGDDSLGSISRLIVAVRGSDAEAQRQLWERCSPKLLSVAQDLLKPGDRTVADEEDIVLTSFHSVIRSLASGRFEALIHRSALWKLLFRVVRSQTISHVRYLRSERRSAQPLPATLRQPADPSTIVEHADALEHLLKVLPTDETRQICVMKLDGFRNSDIAEEIGRSLATIERRLALIREYWKAESENVP